MAVISKGMSRPNTDELFGKDFINTIEKKITSADEVRKEYSINKFPVDVEALLTQLNISIEKRKLDNDISGMLLSQNDRYIIVVEERHPLNRQRFTIAHEIAHYFLHKNLKEKFEDNVFFRGYSSDSLEFQANNFASDLLMPKTVFIEKIKNGMNQIEDLAKFFGVSTLAIRVRAKQLNLTGHGL
mgnify:CR=1 FL=1